ncbi:SprT-like domain-containing protein [Halapricum desulfuricans]|uniref:Zn-dependent metalloprotease, SprT family n=1 Tax=Halapricum desulfuricans TaxID=2841257 RepID=A0A897N5V6_9EURY|nr:SprT-like domain-containing protein [Halapricum desulfuricans]QSG06375.1 Zn-dependent metalloprotease, SprT family [Halapricum desulfuricans]
MKFPKEVATQSKAEPAADSEPTFPDDMGKADLRAAITEYQEWCADHYDELEIDLDGIPVEVSTQMKRTAGKVAHVKHTGEIKYIRYAFKAYQKWGWKQFSETIRHELIHVHTVQNYRQGGHGYRFKALVEPLETTRHCESFAVEDAKYILYCSECDTDVAHRYKRSKTVTEPERYRSKCCNAPLRVETNR